MVEGVGMSSGRVKDSMLQDNNAEANRKRSRELVMCGETSLLVYIPSNPAGPPDLP